MSTEKKKLTAESIRAMKASGVKIAAVTCYSYSVARIINRTDIDIILVGDSLGMVELGYENTLPVTVNEMLHHTKAVKRAAPRALLVADMPFMSYNVSRSQALRSAGKLVKEGGAAAVKLEGGSSAAPKIKFLSDNNIPVMGHLGLMPQAVHRMGGYKVQGKDKKQADDILRDAEAIEEAGVFSIVLEGVPAQLAREVTSRVSVPTIGIGAGPCCDGQILVINDLLGIDPDFKPKFVRRYDNIGQRIQDSLSVYCGDVRSGSFPSGEESY